MKSLFLAHLLPSLSHILTLSLYSLPFFLIEVKYKRSLHISQSTMRIKVHTPISDLIPQRSHLRFQSSYISHFSHNHVTSIHFVRLNITYYVLEDLQLPSPFYPLLSSFTYLLSLLSLLSSILSLTRKVIHSSLFHSNRLPLFVLFNRSLNISGLNRGICSPGGSNIPPGPIFNLSISSFRCDSSALASFASCGGGSGRELGQCWVIF